MGGKTIQLVSAFEDFSSARTGKTGVGVRLFRRQLEPTVFCRTDFWLVIFGGGAVTRHKRHITVPNYNIP